MKILDAYVTKSVVGPFLFGIAGFTAVFVGTDLVRTITLLILDAGLSVRAVAAVVLYSLPGFLVLTFPMGILLASLLGFSRMASTGEITAMRAGGVSFPRIALPVVLLSLFVGIGTFVFNESLVPAANYHRQRVLQEAREEQFPPVQRNFVVKNEAEGDVAQIIFAREFDPGAAVLKEAVIQDFSGGRVERVTEAERVVWLDDMWRMENGTTYSFGLDGRVVPIRFHVQTIRLEQSPTDMQREGKRWDEMSVRELREHIDHLAARGGDVTRALVEYHLRFALPFASLVFALVGTSLGSHRERSGVSYGFGLSVAIILVYYVLMSVSNTLGQEGTIPPVWSAWTANGLFGMVGAWLLVRKGS